MKTLYQIMGDGIEELWYFPNDVTTEEIKEVYSHYNKQGDYDTFEEYLEQYNPQMDAERVFVNEIYV